MLLFMPQQGWPLHTTGALPTFHPALKQAFASCLLCKACNQALLTSS